MEINDTSEIRPSFEAKNESGLSVEDADRIAESRLSIPSFKGPEQAKKYLDRAEDYMIESRRYERQAHDLETQIRRKKQPESMYPQVKALKSKAKSAKSEADRFKNYARKELR